VDDIEEEEFIRQKYARDDEGNALCILRVLVVFIYAKALRSHCDAIALVA
jgi:hypothetical protein